MQTDSLFLGNTVQELVSIALKLQEQGQATCYNLLVKSLQQPHGADQWKYWKVLSTCVASIKPNFTELIEVIFSFDWGRNNETTIAAYVDFLVHLSSAQPIFLVRTLETFVRNFLPKVGPNARIQVNQTERICNHIHAGLKKLLWVIPTASSKLWPLLQDYFPHRVIHVDMQQLYLKNLLCIMDYCPDLRERILHMIIDKMIQIDVEIKLDELPDDDVETKEPEIFDVELEEKQAEIEEMANKLDVMMDIFLDYLNKRPASEIDEIYNILMKCFDQIIIQTHKSKYTQFILFFLCNMKSSYCEHFLNYLCNKMASSNETLHIRQICAAYIGSFLGRAGFVSVHLLKEVLTALIRWIHCYLDIVSNNNQQDLVPDAEKHALFYSVVQAICYIFCFKHRSLLSTEAEREQIKQLNFERIIHSSLNPLKLCLPSVVREFTKIAKFRMPHIQCSAIVERNKTLVLPTKTAFGGQNQIDSYFPFDPYLLRQSSKYFNGIYQEWTNDDSFLLSNDNSAQNGDEEDNHTINESFTNNQQQMNIEMNEASFFDSLDEGSELQTRTRVRNLSIGQRHRSYFQSTLNDHSDTSSTNNSYGSSLNSEHNNNNNNNNNNNSMNGHRQMSLKLSESYERAQLLIQDQPLLDIEWNNKENTNINNNTEPEKINKFFLWQ